MEAFTKYYQTCQEFNTPQKIAELGQMSDQELFNQVRKLYEINGDNISKHDVDIKNFIRETCEYDNVKNSLIEISNAINNSNLKPTTYDEDFKLSEELKILVKNYLSCLDKLFILIKFLFTGINNDFSDLIHYKIFPCHILIDCHNLELMLNKYVESIYDVFSFSLPSK